MAVDFLLSSSSLKAGLVGLCGGGGVAVSRFTVHTLKDKFKHTGNIQIHTDFIIPKVFR